MSKHLIEQAVSNSLQAYFTDLDGAEPSKLYEMMMMVAERPLLIEVMQRTNQNQSKAAQWLGLNRNTLRKKLQDHQLLE